MGVKDRIKIQCSVENIRFFKDNFGILLVSVEKVHEGKPLIDKNNQIIIKGEMAKPIEGNTYTVTGEYVEDKRYGGQYNIIAMYSTLPIGENDSIGQKNFLLALFTENQVKNMYQVLNNPFNTLLSNDTKELVKVKGCGMTTAVSWVSRFNNNYHLAKIFAELPNYHLTNGIVKKLIETYKTSDLAVEKVKNNPYILCKDVKGIGWATADKLALDSGMDKFDPKRISAYIRNYLDEAGNEGRSWISCDELIGAILENLGEEVPDENITTAIHSMEDSLWWNEEKTCIGLMKYYNTENDIAIELLRLRNAKTHIVSEDWEKAIKHIEHQNGWQFTEEQKNGVKLAVENNVIVIHGEAGTGKSSSVSALLEALKHYTYVQCALSGRASARMSEITGVEGYTIHRLLEYSNKGYKMNKENPLNVDVVIVDEISMVSADLFYHLLSAIPSGSKLICLGDMGQLESIGSGNVAFDIIKSCEIPTVYLSKIHRQAAASAIITEARNIRQGKQIVSKDWVGVETRGELKDLTIDCYSDCNNTFYRIVQKFSEAMNQPNFNVIETQVLVAVKNRGNASVYNLNNTLQDMCNPKSKKKAELKIYNMGKPTILRVGDKVINTKNCYSTEPAIFNGNIGIITEIDEEEFTATINFIGIGTVTLDSPLLKNIDLGYAITVHKSQGSQFNHVIFGIDYNAYTLLTRELLYTGITRAKKKCDLIAQTSALRKAVRQESVSRKQTFLQQLLDYHAHTF